MSWIHEVSVNVSSALITAGVAVAVAAQVKASRINSLLSDVDRNLELMLDRVRRTLGDLEAASEAEKAKAHILRIQDEALSDSSKGFRLSRKLIRELESIKAEIEQLDEKRLGRAILGLLFEDEDGKEFLSVISSLRSRVSDIQVRIFFLSFFIP